MSAGGLLLLGVYAFLGFLQGVHPQRIVGGENAASEIPYLVRWVFRYGSGSSSCGGMIINERAILTAAHCVLGTNFGRITAGEYDLSFSSGTEQVLAVTERIPHPNYTTFQEGADLAVLCLASNLTFNEHVAPVSVSTEDLLAGTSVTVSGWGVTRFGGSIASILQTVNITVEENDFCQTQYNTTFKPPIMACAGALAGGKDSCSGDSGGPLVLTGTSVAVGVVSYGLECGLADYPGVYTRLTPYHQWVALTAGTCLSNTSVTPPRTSHSNTPRPLGWLQLLLVLAHLSISISIGRGASASELMRSFQ